MAGSRFEGAEQVVTLKSVWGTGSDNVYAVGDIGIIFRYDGMSWASVEMSATELATEIKSADLRHIWGTGPDNVYVVGDFDPLDSGVSVRANFMLHFDGTTWTRQFLTSDRELDLHSIHGTASNNIYAIGSAHSSASSGSVGSVAVLHFDGNAWTTSTPPTIVAADIWASEKGGYYALTDDGPIRID